MTKIGQKNLKKFYALICLLIILLLIYAGIKIYALFYSELNSKIQLKNGIWNISVNDVDITKEKDINFEIDDISIEENSHVKPGKIAPGLTGKFKISINPENTNVAVRYDISLNKEELTNENLIIESISETKEGNELVKTGENTYTGIITLDEIKEGIQNEITIEIKWVDTEENSNIDINIGTQVNKTFKIPITVHVCQYLGEEINTYVEN